ncbi:hypothetical protein Zmor_005249 [Zophobas morio]|uniref:Uncharacterized protein n=1 Tax=Zophobas morio TaxID=2755281 RepID=A0AA38MM56_9CUCU|nr:hypothetical protein Zmor_005249 [Zophobas morio]
MALFTRLHGFCAVGRCLRVTLMKTNGFHSLSKIPDRSPPTGTRSFFFKFLTRRSKRDLMEADDVPDAFAMIYRNTMSNYILGAQIVSLVTGGVMLMALFFKSEYRNRKETVEWSATAKSSENEEIVYVTIFAVILVLTQMMVSRTPVRIYKVPRTNKYIGINYGHYFFGKDKFNFHLGEISKVESRSILPWSENRYIIQTKTERRPVLLVEYFFRRPADLYIMLGEQKDPDLQEEEEVK